MTRCRVHKLCERLDGFRGQAECALKVANNATHSHDCATWVGSYILKRKILTPALILFRMRKHLATIAALLVLRFESLHPPV